MPVNTFITANGRIRRRITTDEGKVTEQVAVVTNALGSVVATYKDGWLTADRSYDPYDETRAEWNDVGRFGWVGGLGYRETRREWVTHYVRARHYGYPMGLWASVDPLWPSEPAFGYVGGRTLMHSDSSGYRPKLRRGDRRYSFLPYPLSDPIYLVPPGLRMSCLDNTLYWSRQCRESGNKFECCAARVSAMICASVFLFGRLGQFHLAIAFDCQNRCMRKGHQNSILPGWEHARETCCRYGETSPECCEASFRVEQKEYERCARNCFPPLLLLPYSLRIDFGLEVLGCCDK